MARILAVLSCFCCLASSCAAGDSPYLFGPLGPRLPAEDLAAISTLADAAGGEAVALLGWYSQVLPETRYVDAFLSPSRSTARLRRGTVLHLSCRPLDKQPACGAWVERGPRGTYVQPTESGERPIRVTGDIADKDIETLVAYVRSKPQPRAAHGWQSVGVSGFYPILDIIQKGGGAVTIVLSNGHGIGETAEVSRTRHGWHLLSVAGWVE